MEHHFQLGTDTTAPPLLLLHGTGGDEHSLLEIAKLLSPTSTTLALRGEVSENGANRFFRRFHEGAFDLEDVERQADRLLETVMNLSQQYGIPFHDWVVVGYSNGANIGAHLLLERANNFQKAILFHGMSLGKHTQAFDLSQLNIWLSAGTNDPIVPKSEVDALRSAFTSRHASVHELWTNHGHQLTYEEVTDAKLWLQGFTEKSGGF